MISINPIYVICFFTYIIHTTETLAYSMRLAGVRTRQIAVALSFVTSTLLISRLSNMFQAPLLGAMVDGAIIQGTQSALTALEMNFRIVILSGFLGTLTGCFFTPTAVRLFKGAIKRFTDHGSIPRLAISVFRPKNMKLIFKNIRLPRPSQLKNISIKNLPKTFLIMNVLVTSIWTIGVLCSLMAGAYIPEMRSTANQLSGIINGMATILFTLFVDPSGARITDQAMHNIRPESDVKSVVVFLQLGRLLGIFLIAQLFFNPFYHYIMWVTRLLAKVFI